MLASTMLLLLGLAATFSPAAAGHPPSICKGWPAAPSTADDGGATNYTNPDLPDLLTFLNGDVFTPQSVREVQSGLRCKRAKHIINYYPPANTAIDFFNKCKFCNPYV